MIDQIQGILRPAVTATHWRIFGVLMITSLLTLPIAIVVGMVTERDFFLIELVPWIPWVAWLGWILAAGTMLFLRKQSTLGLTGYLSFLLSCPVFLVGAIGESMLADEDQSPAVTMALLFGFYYTVGYMAWALRSAEGGKGVGWQYLKDCFYLFAWPFGVWSIQLRLNELFGAVDTGSSMYYSEFR